ncbi:hypothetical protein RJ641_025235 [Dillenia turbinata]|uniref:Uncharacterized protein n=1 Tax=Dillenia turbinata TaxID=194707 RepID=A0AAN8ZRH3_9MAGN
MGSMIPISIGVGIAANREAKFDTWGVILQLCAAAFEATRLVIIQILPTSMGRGNRLTGHHVYADWAILADLDSKWMMTGMALLTWRPQRIMLTGLIRLTWSPHDGDWASSTDRDDMDADWADLAELHTM